MLKPNSPTPSLQAPRYQLKNGRPPQPPKAAGQALPPPPVRAVRPLPPSSVICVGSPLYCSNIHKCLQSEREPSVPCSLLYFCFIT